MPNDQETYPSKIRRLLNDHDLNALVSALRNPEDPGTRLQAARALGELQDLDASESLVRSALEDPDRQVQAAARRSLEQLLGAQAGLVMRTYQAGSVSADSWLSESGEEEGFARDEDEEAASFDLEGLHQVALHESNPRLRLAAIRMLARSHDMRATDTLAYLALRGDSPSLRDAARQAVEARFGEEAENVLQGYRTALLAGEEDDEFMDEDETEEPQFGAEVRDSGDIAEIEDYEDEEAGAGREDLDEQVERRHPGEYPRVPPEKARYRNSVVEEMGIPWGSILLVGLVVLIVLAALLLSGIL